MHISRSRRLIRSASTGALPALALCVALAACQSSDAASAPLPPAPPPPAPRAAALLDTPSEPAFHWFWDTQNPTTHLIPDRYPTHSFSSIAAVGFGLNAYAIGAERG